MTDRGSKLRVQGKFQAPTVECPDKNPAGSSNWPLSRREVMKVARRFIAGTVSPNGQVPEGRLNAPNQFLFGRPFGTRSGLDLVLALTRWAIVVWLSGTLQRIPA